MTKGLSPPVSRALAVAMLVLIIWLAWTGIVSPLVFLSAKRAAEIDQQAERLAHMQAIVARTSAIREQAGRIDAALVKSDLFWSGSSEPTVNAAIQGALRQRLSASGVRIRTSSDAGSVTQHGLRRIDVHLNVEATMATLSALLTTIEDIKPKLFFESLSVTALERQSAPEQPPTITVDMTVSGYRDLDAPDKKAGP